MPWKEDHLDSSCLTRQKKWGTKQHEVTDKKWCIQAATSCLWYQAKWRKNWLVAITVVGVDRDFQNGFILGKRILVHKYISSTYIGPIFLVWQVREWWVMKLITHFFPTSGQIKAILRMTKLVRYKLGNDKFKLVTLEIQAHS